jgi:hypothetical protein
LPLRPLREIREILTEEEMALFKLGSETALLMQELVNSSEGLPSFLIRRYETPLGIINIIMANRDELTNAFLNMARLLYREIDLVKTGNLTPDPEEPPKTPTIQ